MPSFRFTFAFVACFAVPAALHAATMEIEGDEPRNRIRVNIEEASVEEILQHFSQRYDFELKGLDNTTKGEAISVTMSGDLEEILERLLRNRNYVIVSSSNNESGIQRVILLGKSHGLQSIAKQKANTRRKPDPQIEEVAERLRRRFSAQYD